MAAFLHPISGCGTASSSTASTRKQHWQFGDGYHISHHSIQSLSVFYRGFCWTGALCLLVQTPGCWLFVETFIDIQSCEWGKETCVSVIDRYVTFHHSSNLIPACKVCSKPSWSFMATCWSTMLTSLLRWGLEEDETDDWIPLWTIPSDVNAVSKGPTKCKRAVPVTVAATKLTS